MGEDIVKEVYFYEYCPKCEHYKKNENEEPCEECLTYGYNVYSHRPEKFKSKEEG